MTIPDVILNALSQLPAVLVIVGEHENRPVTLEQQLPLWMLDPGLNAWYAHCGYAAVVVKGDGVDLAFADGDNADLVSLVHAKRVIQPGLVWGDEPLVLAFAIAVVCLPELEAHDAVTGQVRKAEHPGIPAMLA